MSKMRAVILAGGRGTRLSPYTDTVPKPLVSIGGGNTILGIIIKQLVDQGFDHITIAVNHLADLIIDYAGDGSKWGIKIDYSREKSPLNTIGPLTLIPDLPENFLTINGDTLTDMDYGAFLRSHIEKKNRVSVTVKRRELKVDFGVLSFDDNLRLKEFKEKPAHTLHVSIGANCYAREVIEKLSRDSSYGFDTLMNESLSRNEPVSVHIHDGFWLDIGRPEDYRYAIEKYSEIEKILRKK